MPIRSIGSLTVLCSLVITCIWSRLASSRMILTDGTAPRRSSSRQGPAAFRSRASSKTTSGRTAIAFARASALRLSTTSSSIRSACSLRRVAIPSVNNEGAVRTTTRILDKPTPGRMRSSHLDRLMQDERAAQPSGEGCARLVRASAKSAAATRSGSGFLSARVGRCPRRPSEEGPLAPPAGPRHAARDGVPPRARPASSSGLTRMNRAEATEGPRRDSDIDHRLVAGRRPDLRRHSLLPAPSALARY